MKHNHIAKVISVLLVMSMLMAVLAGCGSKTNTESTTTDTTAAATEAASESTTAAESSETSGEPLAFTMVAANTYEDTICQKAVEEKYNVDITIEQVHSDDAEAASLYWATGNIPDVCINRNLEVESLYRQGLLRTIPVEWLEEYAPDYMNSIYDFMGNGDLELGKEMTMSQITVDGEVIYIPRDSLTNHIGMLTCIRQDWLDAVDMDVPTSTEELHDVLTAFTYDDPDGDGANDTYGMHGAARNYRFGYVFASQQWWPNTYYMDDSGKVTFSSASDKCKEMLTLIRSWYEEGIIDPEFITDDRQLQRDKWAQGSFGVLVDHPWRLALNTQGNVQSMVLDANPDAKLTIMEPFADDEGVQYVNSWYPDCISDASVIFGKDCPDEVVKMMLTYYNDLVTDFDFYMQQSYGEEGVDYTYDEDGKISRTETGLSDARAAEYGGSMLNMIGPPRDWYLDKICPKAEAEMYEFVLKYTPTYMDNDFLLPTLDDATAQKVADVTTIANEFYANAISGEVDIETGWEGYLAQLDSAGLQDVLAAYEEGGIK